MDKALRSMLRLRCPDKHVTGYNTSISYSIKVCFCFVVLTYPGAGAKGLV